MRSKDFLDEIQRKFNEDFKSQIPELFDVVFDFDGKKLYAHKYRLSTISSTFKSMLSDRWISKNEAIPIKDYSFEHFKQLLTFLYSGEYEFTDDNIFVFLDMAEFYQVASLKELCDKYLSKMEYTLSNIFHFIELSNKYSMVKMKKAIHDLVFKNFSAFVKCDGFMNASKSVIHEIVTMEQKCAKEHEDIFQAIYEWAEIQAINKQKDSNDANFNMNFGIKTELSEFLPYIQFKKMKLSFLHNFVVSRGFLFTDDELADILENANPTYKVKITNLNGQSIYGYIQHDNCAFEFIKSLKNRKSDNDLFLRIFWEPNCKVPSTPSPLMKKEGVQWYLILSENGYFGASRSSNILYRDYLLVEMYSETDFKVTQKCKIEIE